MGNNENDLSDNIYEQLQKILNECIELWWKPRWYDFIWLNYSIIRTLRVEWKKIIVWWLDHMEMLDFYSYHDLFSKDSGIMEQMEWKEEPQRDWFIWYSDRNFGEPKYETRERQHHAMRMSYLTEKEKVQYFISNAIVPSQK
jgi:hypothetical protein